MSDKRNLFRGLCLIQRIWWHDEYYSLLPPIVSQVQLACSLTSSKGQTGRKVGTQNHWAVTALTGAAARLPKG